MGTDYEPPAGESVETTVRKIIAMAKSRRREVRCKHNVIELVASPDTSAEELLGRYYDLLAVWSVQES